MRAPLSEGWLRYGLQQIRSTPTTIASTISTEMTAVHMLQITNLMLKNGFVLVIRPPFDVISSLVFKVYFAIKGNP